MNAYSYLHENTETYASQNLQVTGTSAIMNSTELTGFFFTEVTFLFLTLLFVFLRDY